MKPARGLNRWVGFAPVTVLAGVVQLLLPWTGVAEAQVIYACANKKGGELFEVANPDDCKKHQTPVSWNVQGPAGPSGPAGPAGAAASNAVPITGNSGFPVVITQPGSYILQANLTPPTNIDAIDISSGNVTIDLNGFSIIGSASASNVWAISTVQTGIVVKNGILSGLGLGLGQNALVEDISVLNCTSTISIAVGSNSIVLRSQVVGGPHRGIVCSGSSVGNNCLFSDDTVSGTGSNGIECFGQGCNVVKSTASDNTAHGLSCDGAGCSFIDNVSNSNGGSGIATLDGTSAASGNVFNGNTNTPIVGATSLGTNLCNGTKC
jgi:hypothetical protein